MKEWLESILAWFLEFAQSFFFWWYEMGLTFAIFLIEIIPVPDFLANMPTYQLPSAVLWVLAPFELVFGLSIMSGAIISRFVIKLMLFRR